MNFTYYTIIGRDPNLLDGHLQNVTQYAGFNKLPCVKKLLVVVYKNNLIPIEITKKIEEVCTRYGAEICYYQEPNNNFLQNLYHCWNLGYREALDGFVFRGGSDQVFSKDSFVSLYNEAMTLKDENFVLQANTIENSQRNLQSRHILAPLGDNFETFDIVNFEKFCNSINSNVTKSLLTLQDSIDYWGKPTGFMSTLGNINRTDGCSWLMKKSDWEIYGPLPVIENGITGDVVIHDRLQKAGYISYITRDCVTYHFVRGESRGITQ